jgi:hypothetical protein
MSIEASKPVPSPAYYTPGRAKRKLMVIVYGIILFGLGFSQLWPPLRLLVSGVRVRGEAASVVKTKQGLPDIVLTDDSQIQTNLEPRDRSYVFWNEFRFHAEDGRELDLRAPVGSQLKPLYPLLDADGLPTTVLICYNPAHPEQVVFPLLISTWFAPGMLVLSGLACMLVGSFLFYWARKPIELPHIQTAAAQSGELK